VLTHLSLFSGIGGIDLAAEWAGFETVGQCEWADYPTKVLEKHWPNVPRWRDIHEITAESFNDRTGLRTVGLISGGFPCQPFSVAGNQKGKEDERYLWPQMLRVISEIKPTWVLGENVPGILRIAADDICKDLERQGYEVFIFNFEAAAVGAKHRRERVFFVGYSKHNGYSTVQELRSNEASSNKRRPEEQKKTGESKRTGKSINEFGLYRSQFGIKQCTDGEVERGNKQTYESRNNEIMANTESIFERGLPFGKNEEITRFIGGSENVSNTYNKRLQIARYESRIKEISAKDGTQFSYRRTVEPELGGVVNGFTGILDGYWIKEPDIPRVATGIKNRVDRLKCLGNMVVPAQVYPILQAIADIETNK